MKLDAQRRKVYVKLETLDLSEYKQIDPKVIQADPEVKQADPEVIQADPEVKEETEIKPEETAPAPDNFEDINVKQADPKDNGPKHRLSVDDATLSESKVLVMPKKRGWPKGKPRKRSSTAQSADMPKVKQPTDIKPEETAPAPDFFEDINVNQADPKVNGRKHHLSGDDATLSESMDFVMPKKRPRGGQGNSAQHLIVLICQSLNRQQT